MLSFKTMITSNFAS